MNLMNSSKLLYKDVTAEIWVGLPLQQSCVRGVNAVEQVICEWLIMLNRLSFEKDIWALFIDKFTKSAII